MVHPDDYMNGFLSIFNSLLTILFCKIKAKSIMPKIATEMEDYFSNSRNLSDVRGSRSVVVATFYTFAPSSSPFPCAV
eukprot:g24341.t1